MTMQSIVQFGTSAGFQPALAHSRNTAGYFVAMGYRA